MLNISRLQTRFVMMLFLGALLFSLLAGAIAYQLAFRRALTESQQTIERLCLTVNTTAAIAAYVGNNDVAKDVVTGLLNNEIVHSARIEAGEAVMLERSKSALEATGAAFQVKCPLYSPFDVQEQVGALLITPNEQAVIDNARTEAAIQVLILVGQIGLTSLLAMALVSMLFSGPIGLVAEKLRGLTPGGPQRLPIPVGHQHDEIGVLVNSSNQLLEATESAFREERRLRAEMEAMERQYRRIFDTTSAGILVLDADGKLINANPKLMKLIGRSAQECHALEGPAFLRSVFAYPEQALALVQQALEQEQTAASDLELRRPDGGRRWVHCLISVQSSGRRVQLIEGVLYDITERKHREREVQHLAEHDVLTGLKNRRGCEQFIERALQQANGCSGGVAVMLIDLDSFKPVNDTLGHAAGDEVLVAVAGKLRHLIRSSSDLVARLGGDEFVLVICENTVDIAGVSRVAEELLRMISQPLTLSNGSTIELGASIGIACYPGAGASCAALLSAADQAMYTVKHSGKNGFAFADSVLSPGAQSLASH